jgi:hypothetical protein
MLPLRAPTLPAKTQRGREHRDPAGENAMVAQMTLMLPDRVGLRHRAFALLAGVIAARPKDFTCCRTICDAVALECDPDGFVPDAAGPIPNPVRRRATPAREFVMLADRAAPLLQCTLSLPAGDGAVVGSVAMLANRVLQRPL